MWVWERISGGGEFDAQQSLCLPGASPPAVAGVTTPTYRLTIRNFFFNRPVSADLRRSRWRRLVYFPFFLFFWYSSERFFRGWRFHRIPRSEDSPPFYRSRGVFHDVPFGGIGQRIAPDWRTNCLFFLFSFKGNLIFFIFWFFLFSLKLCFCVVRDRKKKER